MPEMFDKSVATFPWKFCHTTPWSHKAEFMSELHMVKALRSKYPCKRQLNTKSVIRVWRICGEAYTYAYAYAYVQITPDKIDCPMPIQVDWKLLWKCCMLYVYKIRSDFALVYNNFAFIWMNLVHWIFFLLSLCVSVCVHFFEWFLKQTKKRM